jgi:transcriptional regulator with XRE-family HTH domain
MTGIRRVAGLRREEVAMLAGISSDYYLRLEQGRDRHPSLQVLDALAQVLQLDELATRYLVSLSQERPRTATRRAREIVPAGIRQLLDVLQQPAFVEGRYLDVLAANSLAVALSPNFAVGANRVRDFFLDERERSFFVDWEHAAAGIVAGFRAVVGTDTSDPRLVQLVGELSLASDPFRRLWARHDVQLRAGGATRILHPELGELTLRREKLNISGTEQLLVIYHAGLEHGGSARRHGVARSVAARSEAVSPSASEAGRRMAKSGIVQWHSGPIRRANASVPKPTLPPSSQPITSTVTSIAMRTIQMGRPVRLCRPVIRPSRGPGPSWAPM